MGKSIELMKREKDITGLVKLFGIDDLENQALEALQEIGDPACHDIVYKLATTKDTSLFLKSFIAITKLGAPCVTPLLNQLNHPKTQNRCAVASALGGLAHILDNQDTLSSMIPPLLLALDNGNESLKKETVNALGQISSCLNAGSQRTQLLDLLKSKIESSDFSIKSSTPEFFSRRLGGGNGHKSDDISTRELANVCPSCSTSGGVISICEAYQQAEEPTRYKFAPLDLAIFKEGLDEINLLQKRFLIVMAVISGLIIIGLLLFQKWNFSSWVKIAFVASLMTIVVAFTWKYLNAKKNQEKWQNLTSQWRHLLYCSNCSMFFDPLEGKAYSIDLLQAYLNSDRFMR